jgi:hypothetical protein
MMFMITMPPTKKKVLFFSNQFTPHCAPYRAPFDETVVPATRIVAVGRIRASRLRRTERHAGVVAFLPHHKVLSQLHNHSAKARRAILVAKSDESGRLALPESRYTNSMPRCYRRDKGNTDR